MSLSAGYAADIRHKSPDIQRESPDIQRESPDIHWKVPNIHRKVHNIHRKVHNIHRKVHDIHRKAHNIHRKVHDIHRKARFPPDTCYYAGNFYYFSFVCMSFAKAAGRNLSQLHQILEDIEQVPLVIASARGLTFVRCAAPGLCAAVLFRDDPKQRTGIGGRRGGASRAYAGI